MNIPVQFGTGAFYENTVKFHDIGLDDIGKFKESFLELRVEYEDLEGNLYSLIQFYDLLTLAPHPELILHWRLKYEVLYFCAFSKRKHISKITYSSPEERGFKPVFKRKSF